MQFKDVAIYLEKLESTSSRITITEILSELLSKAHADEIGYLVYLIQGRVGPLYEAIEFGVADKMMIRAIAQAYEVSDEEVTSAFKKLGDIGTAAEAQSAKSKVQSDSSNRKATIKDVFEILHTIAVTSGAGSQEKKLSLLAELFKQVDPLSVRYIARIPLGKLRLGFSDMTVLDALSWMLTGTKEHRKEIERAYNVRPDLGYIATTIKKDGVHGLHHVQPAPGTPILMARANRLSSSEDIIEKIGACAIEYKYDGLRLQVHYSKKQKAKSKDEVDSKIKMFSRNLEDITQMFPDIEAGIVQQIDADDVILEGEVVAYNPHTGVFVPFQETMQRKRKYDIAEKAAEIPVKLFAFELLYCDGTSYLEEPYEVRKKKLKAIIKKGTVLVYAQEHKVSEALEVEKIFDDSVEQHFEGIIAKKLDGKYEAGVRGWSWIKFKKSMSKKLADTVDVMVMGYTLGEGKRTAFGVGQFLTGIYDEENDAFVSISKVGTGLTDDQFKEFVVRAKKLTVKEKPANYDVDKLLTPDVWMQPGLVVEIGSDEVTRSAVHTAGRVMEPSKSGKALSVKTPGFALRFPRLVRFRDDKRPEDSTSVSEIEKLFNLQRGK